MKIAGTGSRKANKLSGEKKNMKSQSCDAHTPLLVLLLYLPYVEEGIFSRFFGGPIDAVVLHHLKLGNVS